MLDCYVRHNPGRGVPACDQTNYMEPKLDGTYDCACLSNDDEDEVKRRGQWWVKQGSGGGVRGEWVAPERGAE